MVISEDIFSILFQRPWAFFAGNPLNFNSFNCLNCIAGLPFFLKSAIAKKGEKVEDLEVLPLNNPHRKPFREPIDN